MIWKRADREQQELYKIDILPNVYHHGKCCTVESILLWTHRFHIHPNFIPQSMQPVKTDMAIKLRMNGSVNGYPFEIVGEGKGQPFE